MDSPRLFTVAVHAYLCFGLLSVIVVRKRLATAHATDDLQATIDLTCLILLLHACGGIASGLGLLLLVPVGGLAFLLPARRPFLAAVTAIAVLADTIWQQFSGHTDIAVYATAGFLGLVLFTIAASASVLATRVRESEDLVRQKDLDLANLAGLSQYIVQHLRESLLVVDASDRIRLINESAAEMLGDVHAVPGALIGEVSPRLLYSLSTWRQSGQQTTRPRASWPPTGAPDPASFRPAGRDRAWSDAHFSGRHQPHGGEGAAKQARCAGSLSASIAHEIRNPVGAMSHAGQLLAESPDIGAGDRRLTDIIRSNSERVSTIINNVLQLSRREAIEPTRLSLGDWLEEFLKEFSETMQVPLGRSACKMSPDELEVRFDPSHLHQVVWNLCDNAIKYGEAHNGIKVEIRLSRLTPSYRPYLEVADRGAGIDPQAADRIFEPFFTGRKGGTGLGLFISRELCQLNRAVLLYEPRGGGGSVFRLVFSDPQRWEG